VYAQRTAGKGAARQSFDSPGGAERRIAAEVAVELRISPRFSDDGTPEGTCERGFSIHIDGVPSEEEAEQEFDLKDEFVRAFGDKPAD